MGEVMKYFLKKLLGHQIFRSMVSWATNMFETFVKRSLTDIDYEGNMFMWLIIKKFQQER